MNHACCIVKGKKMVVEIESDILTGLIDEKDISEMRCPYCNAPAHIVHDSNREWHFRARHESYCDVVNDGRKHKAHKVNENTIIDEPDSILLHRDHAPIIAPGPKPGVDPEAEPQENLADIDEIDTVIKYGSRMIHTVGGIYSYLLESGLDADLGNGMTGRDLFLIPRALRDVRRNGMNGIKVAITKRFYRKNLKHRFAVPNGYTCLCDAFATDIEDAVFFLVKLTRDDQNSIFRDKIMGSPDNPDMKDEHQNILLLGNWREIPHNRYNIFMTDPINSRCYKFANYRDLR